MTYPESPSQSWYSAMVDAVALIVIAALAMAGKVDGSTAVVIIASLTSARVGVGLGKRMGLLTGGREAEKSVDSKRPPPPPPTGVLVALCFFLFSLLHKRV